MRTDVLTSHFKPRRWRRNGWRWTRRKVVAVFSYRFDAHLVPDLLANIDPIVDGWIAYDDRAASEFFSSEQPRRQLLIAAAWEAGTDWILAVDPDERFERGVVDQVGRLISAPGKVAWGFRLRELYTPDSYRIDGIWGQKMQHRLFTAYDPAECPAASLHGPWYSKESGFRALDSRLNLYHLKMIDRRRRLARRDLYKRLDPDSVSQKIGYDYLAEEDGAAFEAIPAGREYRPAHVEDGGLWMADPADHGEPAR